MRHLSYSHCMPLPIAILRSSHSPGSKNSITPHVDIRVGYAANPQFLFHELRPVSLHGHSEDRFRGDPIRGLKFKPITVRSRKFSSTFNNNSKNQRNEDTLHDKKKLQTFVSMVVSVVDSIQMYPVDTFFFLKKARVS